MSTATVIGSGITGPFAAIILRKVMGHEVTVYESRPQADLVSDGILGITPDNWFAMQNMGVKLARYALENTYQKWPETKVTRSFYSYITWSDLHNALTERAEELGVKFHYATPFEWGTTPAGDITVIASGVGSAKQVSDPTYTGYVVLRGLAYQFSGSSWITISGERDGEKFLFNAGDTRDGASIEMFVKRPKGQQRVTYSAVAPAEVSNLPERFRRLTESVPLWQQAPLSDWTVPNRLRLRPEVSEHPIYRLGDANGQMRPQTSMGANLALNEAAHLPLLDDPDVGDGMQQELLAERFEQKYRGEQMDIQRTKFAK